jgi:two-component system OmpR family sensor kinase
VADGAVHFLVVDDGPGFDPAFLPRAFEKFEKHSFSSGTGLGLYVVRLMADAIEAAVSVFTGPGGTTMAVSVPSVSAADRVAA